MNYVCDFDHILTYQEFEKWMQYIHDYKTNHVTFFYPKDESIKLKMQEQYKLFAWRQGLEFEYCEHHMIVRRAHRTTIDYYYKQKFTASAARNRMGCSESWYDPYFAITQTLHPTEVDSLDDDQLDSLVKVVSAVQEALY